MKYKILLAAICLAGLYSCKDEKAEVVTPVNEAPKETFAVALDVIVKKDDSLQLFYKEESMSDYEEGKSVWAPVRGSEEVQQVSFKLPEDVLPSQIRLDFGTNNQQDPIAVKKFAMKYYDKMFQVNDTLFFQYFIPNEQIEWDRKAAVAKFTKKDGTYDPSFFPRETLEAELQKIIK